ncbi:uncharacterized protein LOC111798065 [Cucurbita pepo subsp. pepo]|uniref:uncharacterized protein LOC111798065 n=1 Tax=Cucurbita pepo subsp. pepo TaxID=3664 RepID=UPI000C9D70AA|nr:uncharacterized protein LOC111798065 [Cucurbita pepo subsp. pepo]
MMRTDSGRGSSSRQPEGAEIVYSKENVTIQPTQFASERIRGRLRLIKRESSLFITWIPYEGQNSNAKLSERENSNTERLCIYGRCCGLIICLSTCIYTFVL